MQAKRAAANISARWSKLGRKTRILLGTLFALTLIVILFDWNWFRHPVERYLSERAHRAVRIYDLHVKIGLEPTVRVRGVHIENAPWAQKQAMADAEKPFTFTQERVAEAAGNLSSDPFRRRGPSGKNGGRAPELAAH